MFSLCVGGAGLVSTMPDYHQYIGRVLNGSYRLDTLIRVGGMGGVYQASHTRLPRHFAIKVLPLDSQENPELVIRFQREAEITAALQHPHIVQVTDYNVAEIGVPYLVMELLEGVDLRRHLSKEGQPSLAFLRTLIQQTTAGLQAAHDIGVVHRDLKPSNLFLCPRPHGAFHTKVLDFGVSKIVGTQSEVTSTQASIGTPRYMAPEQARGRAADVDARTDVFALCTMTYEMLTGVSPFVAESIPAMLYRIVHEDPDELTGLRPDLPSSLASAVHRGLAKGREDRYASMREAGLALDAAIAEAIRIGCDQPEATRETMLSGPDDSEPSRTGPPTGGVGRRSWDAAVKGPHGAQVRSRMETAKTRVHTGPATPVPGVSPGAVATISATATGPQVSSLVGSVSETTAPHQGALSAAVAEEAAAVAETQALDVMHHALTEISSGVSLPTFGPTSSLPPGAPPLPSDAWEGSTSEPDASFVTGTASLDPASGVSRKTILISALATIVLAASILVIVLALGDRGGGKAGEGSGAEMGDLGIAARGVGDLAAPSVHRDREDGGAADVSARPPDRDAHMPPSPRHLAVKTRPSGARAIYRGKLIGKTPLVGVVIPASPGSLRLTHAGYGSRTISIPAGQKDLRLSFTLHRKAPRKGSLRIMARRRGAMLWANISVDGRAQGQSPLVLKVTAGKHRIGARRSGYGKASRVVTVRAGGQQSVVLELK
ncbi:MAG: serine/threonine protein kinase [Deltaproteobacteria bacterium]|nr:serine/threonine protein kinase [Deltaproteobacteria bacterium]